VKRFLKEPIPPGTGWSFTFGAVLLFGLAVLGASGLGLALYYAPTPDHAWDSVTYITTQVRAGGFVRGLHYWGTRLVMIVMVLHLVRVVLLGSYRKPRHVNWVVGVALLGVVLAFAMTGLLLPWDQAGYWATVVRIGIARIAPVMGPFAATVMRGGPDIGAMTLTRWYAVHVVVLPAVLAVLVAVHLSVKRRHGLSGPIREQAGEAVPYFPTQAARDVAVVGIAAVILIGLAWHGAPPLDPPADPSATDFLPRPEWYFAGLFQFVKFFPGKFEVIGAIVLPGLAMTLLALLPWLDRGHSRAWAHRRPTIMLFGAAFLTAIALTTLGALDTVPKAGSRWNLREVAGASLLATDRCTSCHKPDGTAAPMTGGHVARSADWLAGHVADPEMIAPGLRQPPARNDRETQAILAALARMRAGAPPPVSAADTRIALLMTRHCLNCHTIDGAGGKEGPDLSHDGAKLQEAVMEQRITNPKSIKPDAKMPAFAGKLTPEEIQALAAWLAERK
jgi:ubiquinol-cytochrome c reductase cytochrome b subunit